MNPILLIALVLLGYSVLSGGGIGGPLQNLTRNPDAFIGFVVALILGITVHEFMHAYAAHRLGDDTGRLMGRLTLNPLAHFDIFGTLLLLLAGFGYGKPVPFNEARLRSALGVSIVALAGPLSNFALAAICAIPLRFGGLDPQGGLYAEILTAVVFYNCILGIFNLLPIPPLDGSNIIYGFLSPMQRFTWRNYQQYGPLVLLALLLLGRDVLGAVVFTPAVALTRLLLGVSFF